MLHCFSKPMKLFCLPPFDHLKSLSNSKIPGRLGGDMIEIYDGGLQGGPVHLN